LRGGIVLDAGCGRGQFLPLLTEVTSGDVIALDMAREHLPDLAASGSKVAADVASLPFPGASVDAVWCANVTQYFGESGFRTLLGEFARVLRPGGLLALKDSDMTGWRIEPAPPFLGLHLAEACAAPGGSDQSAGSVRGRRLAGIMAEAGFLDVEQRTHVIERSAPLDAPSQAFWAEWLLYLAHVARDQRLPEEDAGFWATLATPSGAQAFVTSPAFYGCEMQVVAWGRNPAESSR
jgi:SAM-dependent methyltransferase